MNVLMNTYVHIFAIIIVVLNGWLLLVAHQGKM